MAALRDGEELLGKKIIIQEEFEDVIVKITRAIGEIGKTPKGRNMSDSPESLQGVVSFLRRMGDDVNELGISVAKIEGRSELTLSLIQRLEGSLDEKQLFARKLHDSLSRYLGR